MFVRIETTGRAMPVDPFSDSEGNVFAMKFGSKLIGHVATAGEQLPPGHQPYMPHFATCDARPAPKPKPAPEPTLFDQPTEGATP